tara:strand:+ start:8718 stop:8996 length:279 start_codon:yes stop_codon:yes gene_type:complete
MSNPFDEMRKAQQKAAKEFKDRVKAEKKFFRYVERTGNVPGSSPLSGIPKLIRQAQMLTKLREAKLANERKKKARQAEEADRQQFLKDTTLR